MVNPEPFELPKEQLLAKLKWYEEKYGSSIGNRGLHNWKNLFNKPSLQDWIVLFMLIMMLFVAWSYQRDIQACRNYYDGNVCEICNEQRNPTSPTSLLGNFTINEGIKESAGLKQDNNT